MKIEIELSDLESIKEELKTARQIASDLSHKLALLDEDQIKNEAIKLSLKLFDEYMSRTFKGLGFNENGMRETVQFDCDLKRELYNNWHKRDDLVFNIELSLSKFIREAILSISTIDKK